MKVLVLSDIHSRLPELKAILDFVQEDYGVIVCCGDFTNFGPMSIGEEVVDTLKGTGCFVLGVRGNCDPPEMSGVLTREGISIEGHNIDIGGYHFFGAGGGTRGPHSIDDEHLERVLRGAAVSGGIMVSHMPPKGACDGGQGSEAVKKLVEEFSPKFVFCGHEHGGRGKCELGESVVVNPGPAKDSFFAVVDVEKGAVELGVVKDEKGKTGTE